MCHKELGILPSCVRSPWVEQNTGNSFPSHDLSCSCESIEDHETLSKSSVAARGGVAPLVPDAPRRPHPLHCRAQGRRNRLFLGKPMAWLCFVRTPAERESSILFGYEAQNGLRTPNEGINQRNLKIWAGVADKICFGRNYKFGIGI